MRKTLLVVEQRRLPDVVPLRTDAGLLIVREVSAPEAERHVGDQTLQLGAFVKLIELIIFFCYLIIYICTVFPGCKVHSFDCPINKK